MCKLINIENNMGENIIIADIKAAYIKYIISSANICNKIDYIYVFGSALEERCTETSDIDIAIISNVTRAKLFKDKDYDEFIEKLYDINLEQNYDILQFNSLDALKKSNDFVCKNIISKGKIVYKRAGAEYV